MSNRQSLLCTPCESLHPDHFDCIAPRQGETANPWPFVVPKSQRDWKNSIRVTPCHRSHFLGRHQGRGFAIPQSQEQKRSPMHHVLHTWLTIAGKAVYVCVPHDTSIYIWAKGLIDAVSPTTVLAPCPYTDRHTNYEAMAPVLMRSARSKPAARCSNIASTI
jgi:hypothetical protein